MLVGETDTEPDNSTGPTPVIVALVPLLLAQVRVEDWPEVIEDGLALKDVIIGAPAVVTVTVALTGALVVVEFLTVRV